MKHTSNRALGVEERHLVGDGSRNPGEAHSGGLEEGGLVNGDTFNLSERLHDVDLLNGVDRPVDDDSPCRDLLFGQLSVLSRAQNPSLHVGRA